MFSGVPDSTDLYASSPEVVSCCKSKMAAGKQKLVPFLMVHYQPAVIDSYSSVSRDCRLMVLMSLLLVLECMGISDTAAAKPEVHV